MSPSLSFVDIETTGTSPLYNRIIEIGIVRVDRGKISREYSTLINPQMHIDPFIEALTGISKEDLVDAPTFEDVRSDILEVIDGSIFVAHNVRFDYGFIRNEFKRFEDVFAQKHFCTVKLARHLYPGFKNYNLDAIIERHGIVCKNRHRALGDAKAICDFYFQSIKELGKEKVVHAVGLAMKRPSVPVLNGKLRKYKRLFVVIKTQTEDGYNTVVVKEQDCISD